MRLTKLREWREAQGLTQKELADASAISEFTVARAEHGGETRPNTARKFAEVLGVGVADLIEKPPVPLGGPIPLGEDPEAGQRSSDEPLISRPEVREWLSEQGHETLEEFRSLVEALETLEEVEQAIRELREKRDGLVDKLGDRSVQVKLFGPVRLEGLVGDARLREVFRPTEHARKLKREIRREYDAREDALAEYSSVLFVGGEAGDYLVREPVGERDRERHERLLEARRVFEETYAALSAAV
jgi:transcriptional regulator with XRE-family HTH domain